MKVITFSRTFPATHPQKGTPTFFPEKIIRSLGLADQYISEQRFDWLNDFSLALDEPKYHTIRGGNRWKVGDWFSPRVWSGKPYASKQIEFAPAIQIKKIWEIEIERGNDYWFFKLNGEDISNGRDNFNIDEFVETLSMNDGLSLTDFLNWFDVHPKKRNKTFKGQILCWNPAINY